MNSFVKQTESRLPTLHATLEQYAHPDGARHVHLANDQDELAFVVAFPTIPFASDGRAHILEHLALCGSERFPVSDPFFAMLSRSSALFMNAMTYSDRTLYPFATTDKADFQNLLDVYLDATFFPKLDYLSFRQEGWRYAREGDKLAYQGVVFNEMKGTLGNPMGVLHRGIFENLFEGTTYAFNSGGDPLKIIELSHRELVEFHEAHYHPSQAVFLTSGRIDVDAFHAILEESVISRRSGKMPPKIPGMPAPMPAPRSVSIKVPAQGQQQNDHALQFAWRCGEREDPLARNRLKLFSLAMFGNAAAPGIKAIESSGLGRPSQLSGFDDSARQLVFHLGVQGLTPEQLAPATDLLWTTLQDAASKPGSVDVLNSGLRDLRLQQREVRGGAMPDGMSRLIAAAPSIMYGRDAVSAFDNESTLAQLEEELDEKFVARTAAALVEESNRVIAHAVPDPLFAQERSAREATLLAARERDMTTSDFAAIEDEAIAVATHRKERSDNSVLPRIRPSGLARDPKHVPAPVVSTDGLDIYKVSSNEVAYGTLLFDLRGFDSSDWPWLALYADVLLELGVEGQTYEEAGAWRYRMVPSAAASIDAVREGISSQLVPRLSISARHLAHQSVNIAAVIEAWALRPRFDEHSRIQFSVKAWLDSWIEELEGNARQFADWDAGAPHSPRHSFFNATRGVGALSFVRDLRKQFEQRSGAEFVSRNFKRLHAMLLQAPRRVVWASSATSAPAAFHLVASTSAQRPPATSRSNRLPSPGRANSALRVASQVNHCFAAWVAPPLRHEDSAALAVAAEILRHKILHRRVRETGGAYGGSATYAPDDELFTMSSFRDPRLADTYADFAGAVDELLLEEYASDAVEEAIVGVIKALDRPLQPAAQALEADRLARKGVTLDARKEFRSRVLLTTKGDVTRAAASWLKGVAPSRSAAVGNDVADLAGLEPVDLAAPVG